MSTELACTVAATYAPAVQALVQDKSMYVEIKGVSCVLQYRVNTMGDRHCCVLAQIIHAA